MQGDVVAAARWLGASIVLASAILAVGIHRARSLETGRPTDTSRPQDVGTERHRPAANPDEALSREHGPEQSVLNWDSCTNPPSVAEVWEKILSVKKLDSPLTSRRRPT